ncbi:hypothetical protein Q0N14_06315 [Francisella tularensis subsp. mediasiatica]|uniref:hypothetical protein n=1 Tax=Francisella tularensis TaxID=263 RepID=UPI001F1E25D7|nr:hypothetical protein [Francisella tularensis]MDN9003451.1 hypothetical protein [Francisella tularensis subsp. mediasiatica]MDN9007617.1 hypothetical protein [Francisella tularensis subsp. mediasiatica]WKL70758.1 hypothetical protein Q1H05_09755 [Francisella tularensis subsp. mediasiatica]WKL73189.1 hypothetical protein Q1H03_04530 [Francisella tularensis subsp. mediasiatica]WKL74062.1 hypothetical protein Q1H01_09710 [Francisella tularensis subsp. mediasiatica]
MLFREGFGGIVLGLLLGWIGVRLMNKSDDGNTLIIISLALALGLQQKSMYLSHLLWLLQE